MIGGRIGQVGAALFAAAIVCGCGYQRPLGADLDDPALQTAAERSGFTATMRHDEVMRLCREIASRSEVARLDTMGRSVEGRDLPLLIIADPPVRSAEEARRSGKLVLFAFGGIHSGEACGKEALLMLARDLALAPRKPENRTILEHAVVLLAPLYNADGNERVSPDNRPGQVGPVEGMGERANAQGLDLNREYVKLESPEARALVGLLTQWNPALTIDTHTTNGSRHRYELTYAAPQNPSAHGAPIAFVRDGMLPRVRERLREAHGYDTFWYGDFNADHTQWVTYGHTPRYGAPYRGLRGRMSVLSEAYSYVPFETRVRATLAFVRELFTDAVERRDEVRRALTRAEEETVLAGRSLADARRLGMDKVGIRYEMAAYDEPVTVKGYAIPEDNEALWREQVEAALRGEVPDFGEPVDYTVRHMARFEPTLLVDRPAAYLIPPGHDHIVEKLRQHGIETQPTTLPRVARVQVYTIDEVRRSERAFQGHRLVAVDATPRESTLWIDRGWTRVSTAQPLGNLVVYLLEPESDDGLTTWGFFDDALSPGRDFPILREALGESER